MAPPPVYSASKAAVIHTTKVWATQLAEFGIRVNCISPGAIVTPIFWGGYQTQSVEENERREQRLTAHFATALPLNRAGTPEDTLPTQPCTWPATRAVTPPDTI